MDERSRRRWAAAGSLAIGYGGDAVVSSTTGVARETIRKGRREIARDEAPTDRIRRPGGGRPRIQQDQPGIQAALQALVDPLTRGDPTSPLRWTCKSRAKLAAALTEQGWRVSSTTVGRLLHRLGYRLQSPRKRQEGATHPDRNAQFEHINQTADEHLAAGQPVVSVEDEQTVWLICVPGIGPLSAMAIQAFAPPMERFRRGRDSSAWLGLVPRQHSTGGKPKLGKMSVAPANRLQPDPLLFQESPEFPFRH